MTETPALKPCPTITVEQRLIDYFAEIQDCIASIQGALRHRQQPQDFHFHKAEKACRDGAAFVQRSVGSSAPLSAWLPIESAPKDGTKILAFVRGKGWDVMRYHIPANPDARQFWIGSYLIQPTHWMPLPSAPVGSAPKPDEGGSIATNPSLSALKGGGRDGVIEECAKVADGRAALHVRERRAEMELSLHRGYEIAEETAEEIATAIRSLKSPPSGGE